MTEILLTLDGLDASRRLGAAIGRTLRPGDRILLSGDLGSGKTTLARAIGSALHAEPELTSPTFILVSEHAGDLPIWHIDAYRLPPGSDATRVGILDERQEHGVTLIEWPEHLDGLLLEGEGVLSVQLRSSENGDARVASLTGAGPALLGSLAASGLRWSQPNAGTVDVR